MSAISDKIERKLIGTRVGYVFTAVVCFFGCMFVITNYGTWIPTDPELIASMMTAGFKPEPVVVLDQEQVWSTLQWLIGAIGVAVAGDTARPSGMKAGAFGVTSAPPKTEK